MSLKIIVKYIFDRERKCIRVFVTDLHQNDVKMGQRFM